MQVSEEDVKFLEDNRYHYNLLVNAGMVRHLDGATRSKMQEIIANYFNKGYSADLWCAQCCMEMLKLCYTLYDTWKAKQN